MMLVDSAADRPNILRTHRRLVALATTAFSSSGIFCGSLSHRAANLSRPGTHVCGTIRFGDDPRTSVLDSYCRTHDVPNLFVVDSSFFPSSGAVNPALTIAAQALRVGDHIAQTHCAKEECSPCRVIVHPMPRLCELVCLERTRIAKMALLTPARTCPRAEWSQSPVARNDKARRYAKANRIPRWHAGYMH